MGKSKKIKKLEENHQYLDRKVKELTKDRLKDRSTESKDILSRLKRLLKMQRHTTLFNLYQMVMKHK